MSSPRFDLVRYKSHPPTYVSSAPLQHLQHLGAACERNNYKFVKRPAQLKGWNAFNSQVTEVDDIVCDN